MKKKELLRMAVAFAMAPIAAYAERYLICRLDSTGMGGGDLGSTGGGGDQSTGAALASTGSDGGSTMGSTGAALASTGGSQAFKWGDGWREQVAAGDPKVLARLGRFNSPEDMWRSYTALEGRMSSGELRSSRPKDANPEQLATWRKENGIPEKPDGYELKFDDGLSIGADDLPVVNKFLEVAHKNDMTPAQVKDAISWYYATTEAQTEERAAKDETIARESQDVLRGKWGQDYRPNINAVHSLLDGAPAGFKDLLLNGRLADGTPMGSSVPGLEWLANLSRQINPAATVVPAGTQNVGQAIGAELEKLTAMMGNRNSEYWKGPKADANQARYRELVAAQQQMAARK